MTTEQAKAKHTPKSWKVGKPHGLTKVEIEGTSATSGLSVLVAVCDPDNAPLIAAAPDLLAACEGLIGTMHATTARCGFGRKFAPKNNPCDCSQHAAYNDARAVIAIAKPSEGGAA